MTQAKNNTENVLQLVHHRMNNNMQIISSLLDLEAQHHSDKSVMEVVSAHQSRMRSISLLHHEMLRSNDFQFANINTYVSLLAQDILQSSFSNKKTSLSYNIDSYEFTSEKLIPIGIIVNEVLKNSINHAVCENDILNISIQGLKNENYYFLKLADNGNSYKSNAINENTLGTKLINGFAKQINANLNHHFENGLQVTLEIPLNLSL